ncbi:putative transcriptional regulator, GntR family [Ruminiclostridium papyrosolvens DSM 2782]|uniref:Transcriptional regulator, GntR family n=1 Tax=Ruminiclostridium papyrosolvens DSM 2782 TaxID=588581 RepID=F1TI96_9FIRM|nr:aminotransferase class I/II-fold pyridoxal phosphate-dependent enzyme [Ruminiclostridium papyrosolvens]EGD45874.1 putative transcriptional regulator, GntR family [Ruminiclostridium papyrosolvens DSM 2782]WES36354.1 aminotransferase class I/II-fold pyridoxal phosphate-dependent enzyme [Ruminiclostridium papyrosolvens DSM 2782]
MKSYKDLSKEELKNEIEILEKRYNAFKAQNLKLDMTRGKPCAEQLDISMDILDIPAKELRKAADGTDCFNYGVLDGIPEAKALFAEMLEVNTDEIIVGGNSSLNLMYDTIARAMSLGILGSTPWSKLDGVKFLCPSPGYDRHFAICELFGIEMITVDMKQDGPDMDTVEKLVSEDESIKGIWCVPKYSNPDGITYTDEVVNRFANLKPKAKDFRIFWDNAYCVHHLSENPDKLKNILKACKDAGKENMVYIFSSTSKISFPGAGVAVMATSTENLKGIKKSLTIQTIGHDKINQLRHAKYFKNLEGINTHMKKHAGILEPKFNTVLQILQEELGGKDIASWNKPNGGYFVSLNTLDNCAKEVAKLAGEAGVALTKAGATFPYGNDPRDRNLRIAPTMPPVEELKKAIEVLAICVQLVSASKLLNQ